MTGLRRHVFRILIAVYIFTILISGVSANSKYGFANPNFSSNCQYWSLQVFNSPSHSGTGSATCVSNQFVASASCQSCTVANSYAVQGWAQPYPGWNIPMADDPLHTTCVIFQNGDCTALVTEGYTYRIQVQFSTTALTQIGGLGSWYHVNFDFSAFFSSSPSCSGALNLEFQLNLEHNPSSAGQSCTNSGMGPGWMFAGYDILSSSGGNYLIDITAVISQIISGLGLPPGTITGGMVGVEMNGYSVSSTFMYASFMENYQNYCQGVDCMSCHCPVSPVSKTV